MILYISVLVESPYILVLTDINVTREPSDGYRYVRIFDPQPTVIGTATIFLICCYFLSVSNVL